MIASSALVSVLLVTAPPTAEPGAAARPFEARAALGVLPTLDVEGYLISLLSVESAAVAAAVDAAASRGATCELPAAFQGLLEERAARGSRCTPRDASCLAALGARVGVAHLVTLELEAAEDAVLLDAGLFDVAAGRFVRKERERLPDDVEQVPVFVQRQVAGLLNAWTPVLPPKPLPTTTTAPPLAATGLVDGLGLVRGALLVAGAVSAAGGLGTSALAAAFAGGALGTWLYGGGVVPAKQRTALYVPGNVALWIAPAGLAIGVVGLAGLVSGLVFFEPPSEQPEAAGPPSTDELTRDARAAEE